MAYSEHIKPRKSSNYLIDQKKLTRNQIFSLGLKRSPSK